MIDFVTVGYVFTQTILMTLIVFGLIPDLHPSMQIVGLVACAYFYREVVIEATKGYWIK